MSQQRHLDVVVDDLDIAESAVVELGAPRHEQQPGERLRGFLDPAGRPFRLSLDQAPAPVTLRLIGAGLPRTGTSSLREALRQLLDAPTYHMSEAMAHPEHVASWVSAIEGDPPVWADFLAGYAAGVDAPFSNCWRDLAAAYPEAPVLLSHRGSAEVWYRSMSATVLPRTREILAQADHPMRPLFRVIFADLAGDIDDAEAVMAGYERWLGAVRAEVAPHRLVEWQPGDGWGPICRALGVPTPTLPFPHENSTADYLARAELRASEGR